MADLIDRAALGIDRKNPLVFDKVEYAHGWNCVVEIIQNATAVDAVEVVRCKDCIGQSTWFKDAENGCEVCGMSGMYPKGTFDFCSYGERRKK